MVISEMCYCIEIGRERDNEVSNNIFIENSSISVDARGIGWAKIFFEGKDSTPFRKWKR